MATISALSGALRRVDEPSNLTAFVDHLAADLIHVGGRVGLTRLLAEDEFAPAAREGR